MTSSTGGSRAGDVRGHQGGRDDELMTIAEVAELVRTPVATLRYWRYLGTGPHGFRVGRNLRYWRDDVLAWLEQQGSGSGPSAA